MRSMSTQSQPRPSTTFPFTRKNPRADNGGRPRRAYKENDERFHFDPEDLIVATYGGIYNRTAVITHIPSGLVVDGHDPNFPGSRMAARQTAMRNLKKKLEELGEE